jgi:Domain of unknown function (DUF5060)/Domain of unknown function (DUF5605)/Protein of unknown function (DUF4038)
MKIGRVRVSAFCVVILIAQLVRAASPATAPTSVQQWNTFELTLPGPSTGNPFTDTTFSARFTSSDAAATAQGFYDGDGQYKIRFMPPTLGVWHYQTQSNLPELSNKSGDFTCEKPSPENHGPVQVRNTYHFACADGTPFKPIGTTSYGWLFQTDPVEDRTIASLKASPFNKIRMCVFPTAYAKDPDKPMLFPFAKNSDGSWDYSRFDPKFFQHLDRRIADLRDINVQADVILFHPYGRNELQFSQLAPADADDRYLHYIVARLAAYRNVWWSMANEFDLIRTKKMSDWDRMFQIVQNDDPSNHLRSIHFSIYTYDPTKPWVTHMSVQNGMAVADFGRATWLRDICPKPVVFDEVRYEGDSDARWGQLTGEEMTSRFWFGTIAGTYVGHGEVYKSNTGYSWLSTGGEIRGTSPARIAFFKKIIDDAPPEGIEPLDRYYENHIAGKYGQYYLVYFGTEKPTEWPFELYKYAVQDGMKFTADVLDTWNMTITPVGKTFTMAKKNQYYFADKDGAKIELPGKPYMALRIKRVQENTAEPTTQELGPPPLAQ